MEKKYTLVFDKIIIKQLKNTSKNKAHKQILTKMLNKIENLGPLAGKLLDTRLNIYETKSMKPPIRLYYKIIKTNKEVYIFEYEIKTSSKKQIKTIQKLKKQSKT